MWIRLQNHPMDADNSGPGRLINTDRVFEIAPITRDQYNTKFYGIRFYYDAALWEDELFLAVEERDARLEKLHTIIQHCYELRG